MIRSLTQIMVMMMKTLMRIKMRMVVARLARRSTMDINLLYRLCVRKHLMMFCPEIVMLTTIWGRSHQTALKDIISRWYSTNKRTISQTGSQQSTKKRQVKRTVPSTLLEQDKHLSWESLQQRSIHNHSNTCFNHNRSNHMVGKLCCKVVIMWWLQCLSSTTSTVLRVDGGAPYRKTAILRMTKKTPS